MFPLYYVEVPKGGVIKGQRIVVTHIMFLYEQEKKLFSVQLFGFLQVWKIMLFENTKEHWRDGGVCGSVRWEQLETSPAILSATVGQQCTLVSYLIPTSPQPWGEHPRDLSVCNIKWWLFYLNLGSDHWKMTAWWLVTWLIALGMSVYL